MTDIFTVGWRDFLDGAITAVLAGIVTHLSPLVTSADFTWTSLDWNTLSGVVVTTFLAYLSTKFLSNKEGKFGGVL